MKFLSFVLFFSFSLAHAYYDYSDKRPFVEKYEMDFSLLERSTEFDKEQLYLIKAFLEKATIGNVDNLLNLGSSLPKETALHYLLALGDFENAKAYVKKYGPHTLGVQNSEGILAFVRMLPKTRQHLEAKEQPAQNISGIIAWLEFCSDHVKIKPLLNHKDRYKTSMMTYIKADPDVYLAFKKSSLLSNKLLFNPFNRINIKGIGSPIKRIRSFLKR